MYNQLGLRQLVFGYPPCVLPFTGGLWGMFEIPMRQVSFLKDIFHLLAPKLLFGSVMGEKLRFSAILLQVDTFYVMERR
jgi:hypothetical protein